LASVGAFPDFSLAVWDITLGGLAPPAGSAATAAAAVTGESTSSGGGGSEALVASGRIMLRTKAFGQEVWCARFSGRDSVSSDASTRQVTLIRRVARQRPSFTSHACFALGLLDDVLLSTRRVQGRLVTSGSGHIRFWRMADTFTGLKLQGDLGRFGRVDLSDVADFVELPDGKVLSSSESGFLLLWEGGLVKCQVGRVLHVTAAASDPAAGPQQAPGSTTSTSSRPGSAASAVGGAGAEAKVEACRIHPPLHHHRHHSRRSCRRSLLVAPQPPNPPSRPDMQGTPAAGTQSWPLPMTARCGPCCWSRHWACC